MKIHLKLCFDVKIQLILCSDVKIHLKLCFDIKIYLKLSFNVKIHLKLCFDVKIHLKLCFGLKIVSVFALIWKFKQIYMNLCFDKGNQFLSNQICFLTGKVQIIVLNFVFWQEKSSKMTCIFLWRKDSDKFIRICVFTREINMINIYSLLFIFFQKICFLTGRTGTENWLKFCVLTSKINFFWQEKSSSDVQCLKSQTFFNSCAKTASIFCKRWRESQWN